MSYKNLHLLKFSGSVVFSLILLFLCIVGIAALPYLLLKGTIIGFYPKEYLNTYLAIAQNVFTVFDGNVLLYTGEVPFMKLVPPLYQYSMIVLFSSIAITMMISFTGSYLYVISSSKIQKWIKNILSVTEAIPDIFFIFVLQYGVIILLKTTGIKLFQVYGVQSNVYFTPILCLSIVPVFLLTRMMITIFDEEKEKPYVDFAFSKGLSQTEVFFNHILRNSILSIAHYFNILYWSMLSSLIIIEFLFQMNGFTSIMQKSYQPEMIAVSIFLFMLPYGFLYFFAKFFSILLFGRINYEEK